MKLYVEFTRQGNIKQFLTKVFSAKDDYDNNVLKSVATFYDKECKKIQCKSHKYRSFNDIYLLVKTYYPSVTKRRVMESLFNLELINDSNILYFYHINCGDIENYTICFCSNNSTYDFNEEYHDKPENWEYLFNLIDIDEKKLKIIQNERKEKDD